MAVACSSVGGQAALARTIGRPEQTVSEWANGKSLVDPELVVEIERITGVSRHDLRPDLSRISEGDDKLNEASAETCVRIGLFRGRRLWNS